MTVLDVIVLCWIALWAAVGASRGMAEQVLSLGGLALGALAGSRLAPVILPDGSDSVWVPVVALGGAVAGALVVSAAVVGVARPLLRRLGRGPLRTADQGGGAIVGAALGLALAWLVAAAALYQPGDRYGSGLREQIQRSAVLRAALGTVPPDAVLGALARLDPFPAIPIPAGTLPDPDPASLRLPGVRAASAAVVEVRGRACGVARQGTGWAVGPDLVATNAHVIAGQADTAVRDASGRVRDAEAVYVDGLNDVALLSVPGLGLPVLPLGEPPGAPEPVVLMGHPSGGPLRAVAGTAAPPRTVVTRDAYGGGPVPRRVVVMRGNLGPGSSGGPVIDGDGEVVAMIFGGTPGDEAGAAVPADLVARGLAGPLRPVGTGPCVA